MPREFEGDEKSGLLEVFLERDESKEVVYSLRERNKQSKEGFVRVVPENIQPPVLIRATSVGGEGDYGKIDSNNLKDRCPEGCNAYFAGEAVDFRSSPVIRFKNLNWREDHAHIDYIEHARKGYRLVNFCRVPESYLKR